MNQTTQHPSNPTMTERTRPHHVSAPLTDIFETDEAVVLLTDMPGVSEQDINITLEKDVLTIEGNQEAKARPGYSLAYGEYDTTDFRRVFTLSTAVDRERIQASLRDGVLKLVLSKTEPAKARKIAVTAG